MADIGIITYQLGDIHFGMYADRILEIVQFSGARAIPRPLPYIVGLTKHRKYLVTVVDFRKRLGLPPFDLVPGITMIIAKISSGMVGLLVDSLSHFMRVPETHILPPLSIAGFPEHLLRGVLTEGDDILMIPHLDKIFSSYIPVILLPITPAEKIAFQFRFTPGALTRTLENTLKIQGYLDRIIVNKLPRSMCVPSVMVHKITSYYPDFLPKEITPEPEGWQRLSVREFKAGDETYLSLSQKISAQQIREDKGDTRETYQNKGANNAFFSSGQSTSKEHQLEQLLQHAASFHKGLKNTSKTFKEIMCSKSVAGNHLVDRLQESPAHFSSYLKYYTRDEQSLPGEQRKDICQLSEEHLLELCGTVQRIEDLLYILHNKWQALTRKQVRSIAQQYQVTPVKLAKLCAMFPNIHYIPESTDQEEVSENGLEQTQKPSGHLQKKEREPTDVLQQFQKIARLMSEPSVSRWMQLLHAHHLLTENQAIRYTATQLHISTCRLNKFRSYYQLKLED